LLGGVSCHLEGPRWRDVYLSSSISRGCPKTQIIPAITPEIARIARRIAHQCAYKREERSLKLYKENGVKVNEGNIKKTANGRC